MCLRGGPESANRLDGRLGTRVPERFFFSSIARSQAPIIAHYAQMPPHGPCTVGLNALCRLRGPHGPCTVGAPLCRSQSLFSSIAHPASIEHRSPPLNAPPHGPWAQSLPPNTLSALARARPAWSRRRRPPRSSPCSARPRLCAVSGRTGRARTCVHYMMCGTTEMVNPV